MSLQFSAGDRQVIGVINAKTGQDFRGRLRGTVRKKYLVEEVPLKLETKSDTHKNVPSKKNSGPVFHVRKLK